MILFSLAKQKYNKKKEFMDFQKKYTLFILLKYKKIILEVFKNNSI